MISSSAASTATDAAAETGPIGRCSGRITPLVAITIARWTTFSSSRTLPGQSWPTRRSSASGAPPRSPSSAACLAGKCSTRRGVVRPRSRRAREADDRAARAPAVVVDRPRDQLLAGPRLAAEEHRHVAPRDASDGLVDVLHPRVAADERAELPHLQEPALEPRHLLGEPPRRERALGEEQDLVEVEGLGEAVVGPPLHPLDPGVHRALRGHRDPRRVRAHLAQP